MINELLLQTPVSTAAILGFGFLIGLKHATEADHLAAVSTMVSERRSLWSSAIVGGLWGLGHTISLFAAGILVLVLDFQISEQMERWLEFGVGVMLTLLGINVIRKIITGGTVHLHTHEHGGHKHVHPHVHDHAEVEHPEIAHSKTQSPKALLIGLVHGLAGSAGLMLVMIPTIPSKTVGLVYILVFGLGSIGGMMLMSLLVGLPFHFTALRFGKLNNVLQGIAGAVSVGLGLYIIWEKGFAGAAVA